MLRFSSYYQFPKVSVTNYPPFGTVWEFQGFQVFGARVLYYIYLYHPSCIPYALLSRCSLNICWRAHPVPFPLWEKYLTKWWDYLSPIQRHSRSTTKMVPLGIVVAKAWHFVSLCFKNASILLNCHDFHDESFHE